MRLGKIIMAITLVPICLYVIYKTILDKIKRQFVISKLFTIFVKKINYEKRKFKKWGVSHKS